MINHDEMYFGIKEVAKQIGVVPATIRNWEKSGIFVPKRGENNYRLFSFSDIETLKRIKEYSVDQNVGIHAMRMLFKSNQKHSFEKEEPEVSRQLLSEKWKDYRLKHNYSLEDVAKAIGISPSYLSKIENMQANISINILKRLADFYGENMLYYIDTAQQESHLVRKNQGERFPIDVEGVMVELVVALKDFAISSMIYHIEPGCGRTTSTTHTGQEFIHILSGKLQFTLGTDSEFLLSKGDSLSYHSNEAHRWINPGDQVVTMLWVYTPAIDTKID